MSIDKNSVRLLLPCEIFLVLVSEVDTFSDGTSRFNKNITFLPGKSWRKIYYTPATADFTETDKDDDPGPFVEQSLKFIIPGEDDDTPLLLDEISNRTLIVCMKFTNGQPKVFGCPENGARLKRTSRISSKATSSEIEINCRAQDHAWWLTGVIPD